MGLVGEFNDLQLHVISAKLLLNLGMTKNAIKRHENERLLVPVRPGWYQLYGLPTELLKDCPEPESVAQLVSGSAIVWFDQNTDREFRRYFQARQMIYHAIQHGGTLGCLSAAYLRGIWQGPAAELCLSASKASMPDRGSEIWLTDEVYIGHLLEPSRPNDYLAVHGVVQSLQDIVAHHDETTALCCLESAVHLRQIKESVARILINQAPAKKREKLLADYATGAGSCSETRVRIFLNQNGLDPIPQVQLPGKAGSGAIGIGDYAVVECEATKGSATSLSASERRREAFLARHGITIIRLSWDDVWQRWDETSVQLLKKLELAKPRTALKASA